MQYYVWAMFLRHLTVVGGTSGNMAQLEMVDVPEVVDTQSLDTLVGAFCHRGEGVVWDCSRTEEPSSSLRMLEAVDDQSCLVPLEVRLPLCILDRHTDQNCCGQRRQCTYTFHAPFISRSHRLYASVKQFVST